MAASCSAYMTEDDARAAVERLLGDGIDGARVRVLMGEPARDARTEGAGGYAAATAGDLGAFGGATERAAGMGGFAGDADRMRQGGFGDADRETLTTFPGGVARVRIAGHHDVKAMLLDAGLDEPTADADVRALHAGRVLVLVAA